MHPSITLMLRSPQNRAIAAHILARLGNHGDTMLAHINPMEALALKRMGGAGTINPRTGLRQFDPTGGSNAGGAGHAGDSGHMGGMGDGGPGHVGGGGGFGPGHGGAGIAGGDTRADPGMPGGGTSNPSFGGSGMIGGDYRGHAYNPGVNVNLGRLIGGGLGSIFGGPLGGALLGGIGGAITGDTNIGGGWSPGSGGPTATADGNGLFGGGGPNNAGSNTGQNGGGQSGNRQPTGVPGPTGIGSGNAGVPGTVPAPGMQPAGLPPSANPALAGLFFGGLSGDPFAGRFGSNPYVSPYLIAANQPAAGGYLNGLWR